MLFLTVMVVVMMIVLVEKEVDVWIEEELYLRWEDGEEVMVVWMNVEADGQTLEKLQMWEEEVVVVVVVMEELAVATVCIGSYEEEVVEV